MLNFYDVDKEYVQFLKTIDRQVPNIEYHTNNKFVCGVVLSIHDVKYYAPISHMTNKQRTNMLIYDKGKPISSIRFSFMIPAFDEVLTKKNFSDIAKTDSAYANLLVAEYNYCKSHIQDIQEKALTVYNIGCNKDHVLNYTCCDFQKLEEHYQEYQIEREATTSPQLSVCVSHKVICFLFTIEQDAVRYITVSKQLWQGTG